MFAKRKLSICLEIALAGLSLTVASSAFAAVSSPVGSANVTVADPTVPRPAGKPCVVQLFSNDTFNDFATRPFSYAPPAACPGRWSKVVLEADFSVTAGIQFDRTATIFLDGVNLYFGTTQEPSPTLAPSWHVERDLTDYTALLNHPGQGQADIGNIVNSTYTGVIQGSAKLLFYPATSTAPPARVADVVYPLGSDPVGSTVILSASTDQLTRTLTLPRNIDRAYLDVFAQSQNADEFWYTCVPDQFANEVEECGGGNFREVEVSIDGQPAGVAPVYPWIYTGGIDFFLWEPTPGVQTLNFMPYRVDLTPFVGVLSNGAPHTVALSVAGANNYFSTTASLLIYQDPSLQQVTGKILHNTLVNQAPVPTIGNTLTSDSSGDVAGNITTNLSRHFVIQGYADTSKGRVQTQVTETVSFADTQAFTINATTYKQGTTQTTAATSITQSSIDGVATSGYSEQVTYPLHVVVDEELADDGSVTLATVAHQGYTKSEAHSLGGVTLYSANVNNAVTSGDTLDFDANFDLIGHSGQHSTQSFAFSDSFGGCYRSNVGAINDVVTSFDSGVGCPGQKNVVFWYTHPDGSPSNGNAILNW
jgi:hypothetical protein